MLVGFDLLLFTHPLSFSLLLSCAFTFFSTSFAQVGFSFSLLLLLPRASSPPTPLLLFFLFSCCSFLNLHPRFFVLFPYGSTRGSSSVGNMAVLLEVDGVLADIHKFGHRNGFNVAFQELGLDCANWTEPVYADLLRQAGGIEEAMLTAFFDRIGWPSSLPTNEKDAFVRKVMQGKHRALEKIAASGGLPLRPSIEQFLDEVLQAQVPLLVLSAHSKSGEQVARSLIAQLGPKRESLIKVVGEAEVKSSAYGQLVLSAGTTDDIDEQLSIAASKAVLAEKQRIAEEVASILKVRVEIDTNFTQISRKTIAVLRAAAEIAGLGVDRCILLAGSLTGVQAASRIDMPCVVVRSSGTARAEFPLARATLEDFGAGAITLARLQRFIYEQ
ncbi:unnamed protein product [Sphagnum jensenii]|uniref:Haloacid dehalogenase-like hydrolase domain-containing protein n=1 Tax=Sphagnum jensenii TaxID=128206 RepID=A0ABP1AF84_9BRYO